MTNRAGTGPDGRPRVALLVTSDVSAEAFYAGYPRFLKENGWAVTLIAHSSGRLEALAKADDVQAVSIPFEREPSPIKDLKALMRLLLVFRNLKPDVVVTATPKASLLGMIAARIVGVDARVHQIWGLRYQTEIGLKRAILKFFEKLTARSATHVLANSPSLARFAKEDGIARAVAVLGSGSAAGIDLAKFSPNAEIGPIDDASAEFLGRSPSKPVLGFVGRITPDKGLQTLIETISICQDRNVLFSTLIIGEVESIDLAESIAGIAQKRMIHMVGHVPDPRPYIRAMDLMCLPSRREGFPNVVLEAAALGVPSVVSDATGAVDSVISGVTGVTVKVDDAQEFAAAIERCLRDDAYRLRLAHAGMERVVQHFGQQELWRLQEKYLRSLLSRKI